MFINDEQSPYFTGTRRADRRRNEQYGYQTQALADAGEFALRYGTAPGLWQKSTFTAGALMTHPIRGIGSAYKYAFKGSLLFALPMAAYGGANAARGKAVGNAIGAFSGSILGAAVGGFLAGPAGAIAGASLLSSPIEKGVSAAVNGFANIAKRTNHIKAGGDYKDSEVAYTMRQRAAMEMSTSLLNARRYLGNEAMLMHG